ncbi:uncharacterized protein LOC127710842 [Mytilus californianus]|uniref:uncharacterized protein LOC127710842 n=1 Tax=Mytilus californianus TaxID=6549 RepID=UPI00224516AE|nr:uncharacterized protein LOC127710842 [Mytilus californianus]
MASRSASIRRAQVPMPCGFCNGNKIQWKCEECDIFMCNTCKDKIHGRIKSTKDHEVISFKNIKEDSFSSTEVSSDVISSIFNSYITTIPVSNLQCSDDDILYIIASKDQEKLIKGKMLKASIRTMMSLDEAIFDIAVNKQGELLFTQLSRVPESPLRLLLMSGEIRTLINPNPMRLLALHLNKDNELVCGLREQGPPFPIHDFSVRQVVIFGSDYKRKMTFEFDGKGNRLFSHPARIRTDSKNVTYIVDWIASNLSGRIVALDRSGRLKFSYCGPTYFNFFKPSSIVVTPSDNIVLSDQHNDALLALNSRGNLLAIQFVHELNITTPCALCIDSEGFLLIGCYQDEGQSGKIHAVKLTETLM